MARNSGNKENDSAANCWFFAHFQNKIEHANDIHMKIMAPPQNFVRFRISLKHKLTNRNMSNRNITSLHSALEQLFKELKLAEKDENRLRSIITKHYRMVGDDESAALREAAEEKEENSEENQSNKKEPSKDQEEEDKERREEVKEELEPDGEELDDFLVSPRNIRCKIEFEDDEGSSYSDDFELSQQISLHFDD